MTSNTVTSFSQLSLHPALLQALKEVGYETPSPIQAQTIPLLLEGRDVLGQAQTGTGKTAAFALPLLSTLKTDQSLPQVLVLTPTRELAIQVAEAFQKYARHLKKFHIAPIYGGQDYRVQIRALERGVQVVVGTPGRVMDHIRRGTLRLQELKHLVLDEADEMLRMGFIEDVEWILSNIPEQRQIALFSATMPPQVRRIATQYLNKPEEVTIQVKTATAKDIHQRFWPVSGLHKLDALTRILEAESFDGVIIFVRTKTATLELSEKLEARGYRSAALNGDIPQNQRERIVEQLKSSKLDILIATDVAARGLDVERISLVINYDIPSDTEAYIHRIGRTGRAGRKGDAILFVAPREKRMLHAIERATRQKIELMSLPSTELINKKRINHFKQRITDTLASADLGLFNQLIDEYQQEHEVPGRDIAAALASLLQGDTPLLLAPPTPEKRQPRQRENTKAERRSERRAKAGHATIKVPNGMERFRIEVGHEHKVKPGNIVGAVANEIGLDSKHIGQITINDDHSLIDLPKGLPKGLFEVLKEVWVSGQKLKISRPGQEKVTASKAATAPGKKRFSSKKKRSDRKPARPAKKKAAKARK